MRAPDLNQEVMATRRAAMTLIEMSIAVTVISVGLFLLAGWLGAMRRDARHDLAVRMLAELDKSLMSYHRATGAYPTSRGPNAALWATAALLDHEKSRPLLEALPDSLWRGPGRKNLVDPWGMPLRYDILESQAKSGKAAGARSSGGRPVFTSAGPDGDFGDSDPSNIGDNLRSDDPGPDGFRLQDLVGEPASEEDLSNGEETD